MDRCEFDLQYMSEKIYKISIQRYYINQSSHLAQIQPKKWKSGYADLVEFYLLGTILPIR